MNIHSASESVEFIIESGELEIVRNSQQSTEVPSEHQPLPVNELSAPEMGVFGLGIIALGAFSVWAVRMTNKN